MVFTCLIAEYRGNDALIAVFITIAGDVGEIVSEEEAALDSLNVTTTLVPHLSPKVKGDQRHPLEQQVCTD